MKTIHLMRFPTSMCDFGVNIDHKEVDIWSSCGSMRSVFCVIESTHLFCVDEVLLCFVRIDLLMKL